MTKPSVAQRVARLLIARPVVPLAVLVVLLAGTAITLPRLEVEAGMDAWLDRDTPAWQVLDEIEERFVNDELIFIAYRTDDLFSHRRLVELRTLCERLEKVRIPGPEGSKPRAVIDDVTSLTTIKDLLGSEFSFRAVPLVPDPVPRDAAERDEIRRRAHANPIIADWLLGKDPRVSTIAVRLDSGLEGADQTAVVRVVRAIIAEQQRRVPETEYHVIGRSVVSADMVRYQAEDLARFVPLSYLASLTLLFVFVRRLRSLGVALLSITLAVVAGLGSLVLVGSAINNCSSMMPPVMLALSVAMMLHYFSELPKNAAHRTPAQAAETTLAVLLPPSFIAAATTGIGFGSLSVAGVRAVRGFGQAAALGLLFAFLATAAFFALAARRRPVDEIVSPRAVARSSLFDSLLDALGRLVVARPRAILAASLLLIIAIGLGISRINVDMRELMFFDADTPVRRADAFMQRNLGGATHLIVAIGGPKSGHFTEPDALRRLDRLEQHLVGELEMDRVTSLVGFIKMMHREFLDGDPRYWRIPDTQQQVAQLLLLAGDERMDEFVDGQRQWVRLVARTRQLSLNELQHLYERVETYLEQHFPASAGYVSHASGRPKLSFVVTQRTIRTQSTSLGLSALLIFGLIFLIFRSFKTGVVAIIPNVLPVAANLGLMGWIGINLDAATVMISTIALGIAVDDTVHFLQHYRTSISLHADVTRAVQETLRVKGPAIIWTSVVITSGFILLLISRFAPTRNFGLLISCAMFAALLGDLLILPSILLATRTRLGVRLAEQAPKEIR